MRLDRGPLVGRLATWATAIKDFVRAPASGVLQLRQIVAPI